MIDASLLELLVCPETRQPVTEADAELIGRINAAISDGRATTRGGTRMTEHIDGALLRKDGQVAYVARGGIPVMLIEESLLVAEL
jgi:uncharacterized protein YbaR (Trm112 family)